MAKKETILKLDKLNVEFPLFGGILQREVNHVHAVKDVSFEVKQGETIGIVGESGSGKSVTSLSINRLIPNPPGEIVAGKILYNGTNLLDLSYEELNIGDYPPEANRYLGLGTDRGNIRFILSLRGNAENSLYFNIHNIN